MPVRILHGTYLFLFCSLYASLSVGQFAARVSSEDTLTLQLDASPEGKLIIRELHRDSLATEAIFALGTPRLENQSDLVIPYRISGSRRTLYGVRVEAYAGPGADWQTVDSLAYDFVESREGREKNGRIIWRDIAERYFEYQVPYRVRISFTQSLENWPCPLERPAFTSSQKWPYYLGWGAGAGLVGLGYYFYDQSEQDYRAYEQAWARGDSQQQAPGLEDARNNRNLSEALIWTGVGLLTVNTAGFLWRSIRTKRQQKKYDRFCLD